MQHTTQIVAICTLSTVAASAFPAQSQAATCAVESGPARTPVIELYTSEGCSSCPLADRWLSNLKNGPSPRPVVQAFHVSYWDYIGWVDRFATPANTERQREVARHNGLPSIYTPQLVLNGRDWHDWRSTGRPTPAVAAPMHIRVRQTEPNRFEAQITPSTQAPPRWAAYWTLTENGHSSQLKAGENVGEFLKHDFVVRQYTQAGEYVAQVGQAQTLNWRSLPAVPGLERHINLVVFDPKTGLPLQAVSMACS